MITIGNCFWFGNWFSLRTMMMWYVWWWSVWCDFRFLPGKSKHTIIDNEYETSYMISGFLIVTQTLFIEYFTWQVKNNIFLYRFYSNSQLLSNKYTQNRMKTNNVQPFNRIATSSSCSRTSFSLVFLWILRNVYKIAYLWRSINEWQTICISLSVLRRLFWLSCYVGIWCIRDQASSFL